MENEAQELSVAEQNRRKIIRFVMSLAVQFSVLTIVLFSTVGDHAIAKIILMAYGVFGLFIAVAYIIISFANPTNLANRDLSQLLESTTPSAMVSAFIGSAISIIEITLLASYGWWLLAAIWILAEITQYTMRRKIKQAVALQCNDGEERSDSQKRIDTQLEKYQDEIKEIDDQMRFLLNDGNVLPPEGSLNRIDYDELAAQRDALTDKFTEIVFKEALKPADKE